MHMYDLIMKKKRGEALSRQELDFIVAGAVDGSIPDYQLSAFLMAVCFRGMTAPETADLTLSMAESGEMNDLSDLPGVECRLVNGTAFGGGHMWNVVEMPDGKAVRPWLTAWVDMKSRKFKPESWD